MRVGLSDIIGREVAIEGLNLGVVRGVEYNIYENGWTSSGQPTITLELITDKGKLDELMDLLYMVKTIEGEKEI